MGHHLESRIIRSELATVSERKVSVVDPQEQYFATVGGNEYFRRNFAGQEVAQPHHQALELLMTVAGRELPSQGHAVVLGGAGGREASGLKQRLPDWKVANVDISPEAIEFGKLRFQDIDHHCLSISAASFRLAETLGETDLVFVVGVLPWIGRSKLSRTIANIDDILRDGGLLLISDFLPPTRRKNPIRHAPEHFTYKQDYSEPFLALGIYETVTVLTSVADQPGDISVHERRRSTHLLRKDLSGLYPIGYAG